MMSRFKVLLCCSCLVLLVSAFPQKPRSYHAGEIQLMLNKLNVLGTVLYVAAHPDDENTTLIAYFANEGLYRTAYLSATRGDGGQNLVGPEIREKLGVIRTQELLAARRLDGGRQFFSRANDFGYSKHPDETLQVWEKDKVLSDFVKVIREFRPDIIVTRFSPVPRRTHGHHTSSAILAVEAFKLAGDPTAYPEHLEFLKPWQPKKLFWNAGWWFYRTTGQKFDTAQHRGVDVGTYNPFTGKSYTEIAAESRSMHKSQGFGATGRRGTDVEYLKPMAGDTAGQIFDGIETSWARVDGAEGIQALLEEAATTYDPRAPEQSLDKLFAARKELVGLRDQFWKEVKISEVDEVVKAISGTYLEVTANDYSYVPGDSISFQVEAISRLDVGFELQEISLEPVGAKIMVDQRLTSNDKFNTDVSAIVPEIPVSNPYWLNEKAKLGMYHVEDPKKIGKPENDPVFTARFVLKWQDQYLEYETPVNYKRNDPVNGETYQPIEIIPEMMVNLESEIVIFGNGEAKDLDVRVISGRSGTSGIVQFDIPQGWIITPQDIPVAFDQKGEEQVHRVAVSPPSGASEATLSAKITLQDGTEITSGKTLISYDHIPIQTVFPPARVKLVKLDLVKHGNRIGYIEGAGDALPENLSQIGYAVEILQKDDVVSSELSRFDAVILGVRAFNTVDWLAYKNEELFEYVRNGGNVIVQYNTSHRLVTEKVAPYPITLSRDRVAVETAEVRLLEPNHSILTGPNKITTNDFEGWVQERGLYFPSEWDDKFVPLFSSNDPGEEPKDGGTLVARYGDGYYIYTGYSWFRELPAGVPGAYRIFVNMISAGKSKDQ